MSTKKNLGLFWSTVRSGVVYMHQSKLNDSVKRDLEIGFINTYITCELQERINFFHDVVNRRIYKIHQDHHCTGDYDYSHIQKMEYSHAKAWLAAHEEDEVIEFIKDI